MTKWKRKKGTRNFVANIDGHKVLIERDIIAGSQAWKLSIDGERRDPRDGHGCMTWSPTLDAAKQRAEDLLAGAPA